jgi:hypothetical protein
MKDIAAIKDGSKPSFSFLSLDAFKMWDPYKPISAKLVPYEGAANWLDHLGAKKGERINITHMAPDGTPVLEVEQGVYIGFQLEELEDEDKFVEYSQDKDDQSRLPKQLQEGIEKDLLCIQWSNDGGKFMDEKESAGKMWQAPQQSGQYKISVHVDDLGLVHSPDKGARKDSPKDFSIIVSVK